MSDAEKGSTVPLLAAVVVLVGIVIAGLGRLGSAAVSSATARTAADAAALGGAAEGEETARQLAGANGAELVDYRRMGSDVRVTVRVGSSSAVARATLVDGVAPTGAPPRLSLPLRR